MSGIRGWSVASALLTMEILSREGRVTRHGDEGHRGEGAWGGRPAHSCHVSMHAEIRRVAMELRPLLRGPSVQPDFSGKFRPRVRRARALLRSEQCAEAFDELQDLKAVLESSIL